jgi:pimeloyl-ACP methyl ester carboxylesterase
MRSRLLLALIVAAACSKRSPPEPRTPAPSTPASGAPAPGAKAALDEGTIRISARGKPAGEERFRITGDDQRREIATTTTLRRTGLEVSIEGTLVTDGSARPLSGSFRHVAREGDKETTSVHTLARRASDAGAAPLELTVDRNPPHPEAAPSDLFVHNLVVSHLAPLCRLAGEDEREVKLFPGLTLHVAPATGVEFATKAGTRALTLVIFRPAGGEPVDVLCDGDKLAMVRQPAVQVVSTREGYEEIAELIAEAEDRKPKLPEGLVELERRVRAPDGVPLACALVTPVEKRSLLPAVLLLGPAGAQDRDGDTVGHGGLKAALLKHIAIALGQSGIASLRCDDRGVGDSGGVSGGDQPLASMAGDAALQLAALRAEPGIDAERAGILGHGEGATLAQLVAGDDPRVKALALLAPMGRRFDQVNLDRRAEEMRRLGIKESVVRDERKRFAAIYDAIRLGRTVPEDTPDETRAALAPVLLYLQSHFRHDPAFTARKIEVPVLIAHGGRDIEIPPGEAKLLHRLYTRAGNRKARVEIYPQLNHLFTQAKRGTPEDYLDRELSVDLAAIGDVVTFFKSSL